jgi:hypothetical protein
VVLEGLWAFMMEQINDGYDIFLSSWITCAKQQDGKGAPIIHDNTIYLMRLNSQVWTTWVKYF